ncbi:MAG: hypothetical protein VYD12_20460, partial [Pseudomonadota bacterium]|nr:hypothetical protein [Pseudomonadota bacterium]
QVVHFPSGESGNIVLLATKKPRGMDRQSLQSRIEKLKEARPKLPPNFGRRILGLRTAPPPSARLSHARFRDHGWCRIPPHPSSRTRSGT